jgi:hypothetical protein
VQSTHPATARNAAKLEHYWTSTLSYCRSVVSVGLSACRARVTIDASRIDSILSHLGFKHCDKGKEGGLQRDEAGDMPCPAAC